MFWRDPSPIQDYKWNGLVIDVNLAFDNVLMLLELMQDEAFKPHERLYIGFEIFTEQEVSEQFDVTSRVDFMIKMMRDLLDLDLEKEQDDAPVPTFDFFEDAGRIYASFLYDYNIDLYARQGKMGWSDFLQLLENLSEDTQVQKAIGYRKMKVPRRTEYNKEEIKNIEDMKKKYAFKSERLQKQVKAAKDREALAKMQAQSARLKAALQQKGGN
jgi:hypothetical protein